MFRFFNYPEPKEGILIVLAAEQHFDGRIGPISQQRCQQTVDLFRKGQFSRILVSGGASNRRKPPLAEVMYDFLEAAGVPGEMILVESASTSTRLNAVQSAKLLSDLRGPFILITCDYHVFRAKLCFRRCGIAVIPWTLTDQYRSGMTLAKEAGKILYYWIRGWI